MKHKAIHDPKNFPLIRRSKKRGTKLIWKDIKKIEKRVAIGTKVTEGVADLDLYPPSAITKNTKKIRRTKRKRKTKKIKVTRSIINQSIKRSTIARTNLDGVATRMKR